MLRSTLLSLGLAALCAQPGLAQPNPDDVPELPPVTIPGETGAGDAPTFPTPAPRPAVNPWNLPDSYPSLRQQEFSGINGITRSDVSLFDLPEFGTITDRKEIEQRNSIDMFSALEREVGILMQRTARGQSSPFIRGFTGQQIVVLIDGVRTNTSILRSGPNQYFNLVDPGQVERIEVIRGPGSVLWGSDALGGVINIVTRSPDSNRGNYVGGSVQEIFSTADLGSYTRVNGQGWTGPVGVFAGASYLNVNDLDRGGDLGRQPFTDYGQYAGDMKLQTWLTDDAMLTFSLQHFEQYDVPRSDRFEPFVLGPPANTPRPTFFDPQQRDLVYVNLTGVAIDNPFYDAYTITGSYQRNKEGTIEFRSPTRTDVGEFDVNTGGVSLAFAREFEYFGNLSYGADYYYDDIDAERFRLNPSSPATPPLQTPPQFPNNGRYDRGGIFAAWQVALTERLDVFTGLRYENANAQGTVTVANNPGPGTTDVFFDTNYNDVIGSIGFVYELDPDLHLVGGIYEGYRAPNISDLASNNTFQQNATAAPSLPGLGIQPEHTITYEVGLKYDGPRFRAQAVEYWVDIEDLIGSAETQPGVVTPVNFAEAYQNGTEFQAEFLLTGGFSVYGNYWYTYGRNITLDEPLSRMPPQQGVLGIRWRDPENTRYIDFYTWMVDRQERYASANLTDARFPIGGTPGYATLNMRMGRSFGVRENHRVSFVLENINDKAYRVLGSGVDGPGINAIFGYELGM